MHTMKSVLCVLFIAAAIVGLCVFPAQAQKNSASQEAVAAAVLAYHGALAKGDRTAALNLLAADVVILEGGGLESREQYLAHHLADDIKFAQAVPSQRSAIQVTVSGDVAWATSTSETKGSFRNRDIDMVGAELMVLSKTEKGWLIRAIHWSARPRS